jgi:hypothetical protein
MSEDLGAQNVLRDAAGSAKLDLLHAVFQAYRFDLLDRFGRFERRLGSLPRLGGLGGLHRLRHRLEGILILWRRWRRLRWGRRLLSYHAIGDQAAETKYGCCQAVTPAKDHEKT